MGKGLTKLYLPLQQAASDQLLKPLFRSIGPVDTWIEKLCIS
jgi:hypothetical protein